MAKKSFIIYTLIFSVILSVIMIITSYYGLDRYIKLQYSNPTTYIKEYSSLQEADPNSRVVVSLTCTPDEISKIEPTLLSVLDQTVKVNQISLNVSKDCAIPNQYNDMCNVYGFCKDYGDGTKYIPTLLREGDKDTKIICLDNAYIYGGDLIETLVNESNKNPDLTIYTKGAILFKPRFVSPEIVDRLKSDFDDKWLFDNINVDKKEIEYDEIYRRFGK